MSEASVNQKKYLHEQKKYHRIIKYSRFLIFIFFLLLWEGAAYFRLIDPFIFSSPSKIVVCFYTMLMKDALITHIGITLFETLVSFLLVLFFALAITVFLWFHQGISAALEPCLVVLNSLPKSALAPLLIVWLGANFKTIIVTGMSVAIFGSILSLYTAFQTVDEEKIKLIYTLGGTKKHVMTKVILPSNIPTLFSIMKVNIGLCLVGVIIGEFIAARSGLGYLIIYGSQVFKLDWVLMSIVILCILAMLLYGLLGFAEKRYLKQL